MPGSQLAFYVAAGDLLSYSQSPSLFLKLASSKPEANQKLPEADVAVFHNFLRQQASLLTQYPLLLLQQAASQPEESPVCCQAPLLTQRWHDQFTLKWINKPQTLKGQQR